MSSAGPQGFHILLEAEKEASTIVNQARQYRAQRLKDARTEALEEIEALKKRKNEDLLDIDKKYVGELEASLHDFEQRTEQELEECATLIERNQEKVVEFLLTGVKRCEPALHPNAALKLSLKKPAKGN